jgi:hypothetical protein
MTSSNEETKKKCSTCGELKDRKDFHQASKCRVCKAKYLKELYVRKRDDRLKKAREYRLAHLDERRIYKREWASRPHIKPVLAAKRKVQRDKKSYENFARACLIFRELEEFLRVDPLTIATVPARRHRFTRREKEKHEREQRAAESKT